MSDGKQKESAVGRLARKMSGLSLLHVIVFVGMIVEVVKTLKLIPFITTARAVDRLHRPGIILRLVVRHAIKKYIDEPGQQSELETAFWEGCQEVTEEQLAGLFDEVP